MKFIAKILAFLIIDLVESRMTLTNDFAELVEFDEEYIKFHSFKFYKKTRTIAALNVTYETLMDIVSDEQVKMLISAFQLKNNVYKRTVIDFSLGVCTIYRANKFDAMNIIKNSNLTTGCPFPKGSYYINDASPTADMLPPFFPEGKWMIVLAFNYTGKVITKVHWMLTIKKEI